MISNILGWITLIIIIVYFFSYGVEMTVYGMLSILNSLDLRKSSKEEKDDEIALEKMRPKLENYIKIPIILLVITLFFFVIGL